MSVLTKFWIYTAVEIVVLVGLMVKTSQNRSWIVVLFAAMLILGAGSYFFRCPRCGWPIVSYRRVWLIAGNPGTHCRRCGVHLGN